MKGLSKTRLYGIFSGMKSRCYNSNDKHFKWYGAKGITICDEWICENGIQNFIEWALNNGYEEHLTIDRIDTNGNYEPSNCQWVTRELNSSRAHLRIPSSREAHNIREYIRLCCVKRGNMTEAELARRTGQTPQNLNNKYKRNTFKISELEKVADALDARLEIAFVDKETGEPII